MRCRPAITLSFGLALASAATAGDYQLKPGETLARVATAFYGAAAYQLTLAKYNRLADVKAAAAGATVRAPDLKTMLMTEGISKEVERDVDLIIAARYAYLKNENEVRKSLARAPDGGKATQSEPVRRALRNAAADLESGARAMAKKAAYAESPVRAKRRLEDAARAMRDLAAGVNDAALPDRVHLRLAQAWVRLLMWARHE